MLALRLGLALGFLDWPGWGAPWLFPWGSLHCLGWVIVVPALRASGCGGLTCASVACGLAHHVSPARTVPSLCCLAVRGIWVRSLFSALAVGTVIVRGLLGGAMPDAGRACMALGSAFWACL